MKEVKDRSEHPPNGYAWEWDLPWSDDQWQEVLADVEDAQKRIEESDRNALAASIDDLCLR